MTISRNRMGRAAAMTLSALLLIPVTSCERVRTDLLDAVDPDIIQPSTISSPEAADALRIGTLSRFRGITAGGEAWLLPGMLADEWKSSNTFSQHNETDQRSVQESNSVLQGVSRGFPRVRTSAREAINALTQYNPAPAWGRDRISTPAGAGSVRQCTQCIRAASSPDRMLRSLLRAIAPRT